ncbi:MAG TPA: four helix bundle protein [Chitinophagaceae bacterium]|jgi:four helix bundle protein|nr:four helix bundle protein [Chitinophagaceae bacterium]
MFLQLNHKKLGIHQVVKDLVVETYRITAGFPSGEQFTLVIQIRRAVLSVHLNISEGSARRSTNERLRFYEIARSSLVEVDAAFELANDLSFLQHIALDKLRQLIIKSFVMLTGLIHSTQQSTH